MNACPAKAVAFGLMLLTGPAFPPVAQAAPDTDFATLQAAAEKARQEARTAEASRNQGAAQQQKKDAGSSSDQSDEGGLTESQVRVMLGLAWSIVPAEYRDSDGNAVKVDRANPNQYLIPVSDARRIIRAASRTAYANICNLQEHQASNQKAMLQYERAQGDWTSDQMMFIETLHFFSVAQMLGAVKIEEVEVRRPGEPVQAEAAAESDAAKPESAPVQAEIGCPPAQKEKVQKAIDAYVAAVEKEVAGKSQ